MQRTFTLTLEMNEESLRAKFMTDVGEEGCLCTVQFSEYFDSLSLFFMSRCICKCSCNLTCEQRKESSIRFIQLSPLIESSNYDSNRFSLSRRTDGKHH